MDLQSAISLGEEQEFDSLNHTTVNELAVRQEQVRVGERQGQQLKGEVREYTNRIRRGAGRGGVGNGPDGCCIHHID